LHKDELHGDRDKVEATSWEVMMMDQPIKLTEEFLPEDLLNAVRVFMAFL
jgi:hypothetical protein